MKRIKLWVVLVLSVCISFTSVSATALTSAEKEEMYGAAVLEFETYLENPGKSNSELLGIINSFEELGGYEQSMLMHLSQELKIRYIQHGQKATFVCG